jgi:8-oxo-dGTP pyrophosphatase MutT (NUDIX family)
VSVRQSAIALLRDWKAPNRGQDSLRHAVLAFLDARDDGCLRRWVQLGGHCEPDDGDIVAAALREATEESGVDGLRIEPDLVAIHVHALTCSLGVPTRHLDLQFLAHAPAEAHIAVSDESVDLRWWPADNLPAGSDQALAYLVDRAVHTSDE